MKKLKFTLPLLLLLCATTVGAQQVPKVVGTITEKNIVNRFGPDGNDYYGFQSYWRNVNIDASGSQFENLVLKMRVYIDNLDNPGDISFIRDAGFAMIELGNEQTPTDTYVQWSIKALPTPLEHGWTEVYLPLTTGDKKANFDLMKPINWFRFCFARIPGEPDALQIRLRDVQLIDTSMLIDPPDDENDEWNTDYHVADIPYTLDKPLALNTTFAVGQQIVPPVDASAHNPQQLYLMFDADITEQTPGDLFILSRVSGQIELTSTTGPDQKEMLWGIGSVDWKAGEHTYALPFATSGNSGGNLELDHISFIRFYAVNVPADYTGRIQMRVANVKIVDFTNQTKLPALFGNKMMFQQNKPIKIWGTAVAGKILTVDFYKSDAKIDSKNVTVPESGRWEATFDAQTAGFDKYRIEVLEGATPIQTVEDILIGEVWLSSGQSNMALNVAGTIDGQELMTNADNDNIRFFLEPTANIAPWTPNTDIQGAYWGSADDGMQLGKVSAVAFAMAAKLQQQLNIPIGIINTAVGGSVIEAWLPVRDIDTDPELMLEMKRLGLYLDEDFYPDGTNQMSSFYNLKIHPLSGYNICGMIWYQGESNSQRAHIYARQLDLLKKSYERLFGFTDNNMPFIFCQLCPWVQSLENPQNLTSIAEAMYDAWAMNRDDMAMLPLYDTDMTYVGNVVIHPTNKTPVGQRFATAALNMVYNRSGEYTAPVFDSFRTLGDTLIVKFTHVGDGLKTVTGIDDVRGFAVCNENNVYAGAKARIISADEVAVWNERVKNPLQMTYAWASYNVTSNLANSVDIPAAPFRSDRLSADVKHYNPQDWSYADGDIWGVDASDNVDFLPAWTTSDNATTTYDESLKSEGKASLKVDYTLSEAGVASVEPVLTHKTVVLQPADFNTISFDILNPDDREKEISLLLKSETATCKAVFIGYEDTEARTTSVTIGKTAGFHTLTFLLKDLITESGEAVTDPDEVLNNLINLQPTVGDNTDGVIYIDNVLFGFSTEKQPVTTAVAAPVNEHAVRIVTSKDALIITSDANDVLNRIDVFDLQGKTIYSKAGIDRPEHSVEMKLLSGNHLCIVKVRTANLVSAKKIILEAGS
jgi:sialate O-acetylesterase